MPDFSKSWGSVIEREFGYTKKMWTQHRNELANMTVLTSEKWIKRVMERVIKHRANMLENTVKYLLAQEHEPRFPVMPYVEGQVVHTPDSISPKDKSKWKKISSGTPPTPFYQRMGNLSLGEKDPVKKVIQFSGGHNYPTFNLKDGWRDNLPNQFPDHIIATGVIDGQIIIVNNIQYVLKKSKGSKEPTNQNPQGHIFIAVPKLKGG